MSPLPGRLVLIGHPVGHSLSPLFQNAALRRAEIPLRYETIDVPPDELRDVVAGLRAIGAAGNVTIPHKEAVAAQCDALTPLAVRAGAVNTFWCADGQLWGDNTDVGGFEAAAAAVLGVDLITRPVALLGAGGAAAAVLTALERRAVSEVRVVARSSDRAERLASRFSPMAYVAANAEEALRGAGLVVNATPIGLRDDSIPVDPASLEPGAAVIDLVYRPGGTAWVRAATRLGLRAVDGTVVLLEQGALAFERWFGVAPDRRAMREALRA